MEASRFIRTSLISSLAVFAASSAFAVPAAPGLRTLQQPDGSSFEARKWGDERVHGWETRDGYSIVYDSAQRSWTYAVRGSGGRLVSSGAPVTSAAPSAAKHLRPSAEAIAAVPSRLNDRQKQLLRAAAIGNPPQHAIPTTGTGHLLTLLVNFSDRTFTNTQGEFNTLIYGAAGTKSVNDHYLEMSHGQYSLTGEVKGPYTAANTHDYYGANISGNDAYPGTLVREAVAALEAADSLFDWSPYDQDGDCYVDSLSVIHQGTGEEDSSSATDIWSHSWNLNSAYYWGNSDGGAYTTHTDCTAGGKIKVNAYVIQPERSGTGMITIGVFSHEYGHALGLPDLYDTDYSSEGVGEWSLMASGSWNQVTNPGDRPAHMDPWSKWALGWLTPTSVSGTLTDESIAAASAAADVYILGTGTATSGEYFLVENRQQSGFDAGLPGAGLLVWHVDTAQSGNDNECMPGYCPSGHYKVSLEQADGLYDLENGSNYGGNRGDANDPFYSGNSTAFNAGSTPNSNWWNATPSNARVTAISASGATMTATLSYGSTNTAPVAADDTYSATAGTTLDVAATSGVLLNDSDADGDTLTATLVASPLNGSVSLNADGSFAYSPAAGFTGTDTFTYKANDGTADSGVATVTITVAAAATEDSGGGGGGGAFGPLALLMLPSLLRRRRFA